MAANSRQRGASEHGLDSLREDAEAQVSRKTENWRRHGDFTA